MLQEPWIQDGITANDANAIIDLAWIIRDAPALTERMLNLPWIQDGSITDHEVTVIDSMYRVLRYAEAPALAERMLQKSWVQDDITRDEGIIIRSLYRIAQRTDEATQQKMTDVAIRIIAMPFLDDVTFAEARAVMSLHYLASSRYQDSFRAIMSHPKVLDGITDQEAKVISVLRTPAYYTPEAIPHLLDGLDGTGGVYLEERTIQMPLTGETLLTIVRTQNRTTTSMGYLEHSVRFAERLMAAPLPTNYVALYFGSLGPRAGANNWWTHMAMRQSSDGLEEKASTIAHEVAHFYFRDSISKWIDEGAAELIQAVSEHERAGYQLGTLLNKPCDNIKTLPASDPDEYNHCAYYLGGAFYIDMYRTLGEDAFLQGFRALYRMHPGDHCWECTDLNVHHVIEAFTTNVPEDTAAKAKNVLLKWYGPLP